MTACYECEVFTAEPYNSLCAMCADLELMDGECGPCVDMSNEIQERV